MKLEFSQKIFAKSSNIKFHQDQSSGSRVVACGQKDGRTDGQTDMTKLILTFRNFADATKNWDELRRKSEGLLINLTPHLRLIPYGLPAMTTGNALHIVAIFI
jgi:hypothetical protein